MSEAEACMIKNRYNLRLHVCVTLKISGSNLISAIKLKEVGDSSVVIP